MCPAVAVIPVEVSRDGEIRVERRRIRDITDEGADVCFVIESEPGGIEVCDYGGGIDKVSVASPSISC